jgi:hypothetical protein
MIDRSTLLTDLQHLLGTIEADLLERSASSEVPDIGMKLRAEYASAQSAERTAQNFTDWLSDAITQSAAAWVLSSVFVRFLEDNDLIPAPKLSGPGDRLQRARDEHELFFRSHPKLTDRDYLLAVFDGLISHAGTKDIFGEHNPIRDLPNWLSGDAAGALIAFFQKVDPGTGRLAHDFTDPTWDTRFLGDLYQDLSEAARKKYALLQTPVFVEEFILDRTLDPAIDEFGLAKMGYENRLLPDGRLDPSDRFKMIDPACGSGHFLLGSFTRLVDRWRRKEPGSKTTVLVQRALDSVHGVDLNPYAIAIARFRLLLAALKECGITRLSNAPAFEFQLACGDSLLHGRPGGEQLSMGWSAVDHVYQPEDQHALDHLLQPGRYHAVVANPPYITPKDSALNTAYRDRYGTCHRQYSLAVPFMERITSLGVEGGFTGQITANSFMKREFGKKLIEEFFPRVDLTHVIDTSGAYIPGHGTPTVILFARIRKPVLSKLRSVMGIRGEPSTPDDPSKGLVWSAIIEQVDRPGSHSEFVSVSDRARALFHNHPWSVGGGGASELKERLDDAAAVRLADVVTSIGFYQDTHADEAFVQPARFPDRRATRQAFRAQVRGDDIRDWSASSDESIFFPYDNRLDRWLEVPRGSAWAWLYALRTELWARSTFGGGTYRTTGRPWFDYHQFPKDRARTPMSIAFAFVATHNHFLLDRGGKVFNRSAPVIKLPAEATEDDYLTLLGLLNSSTACFWMKQVFHDKGSTVDSHGARQTTIAFENFREFTGTGLQKFPVPEHRPFELASKLDDHAQRLQSHAPSGLLHRWQERGIMPGDSVRDAFEICEREAVGIRAQMIALQEELDWRCYRLYGLIEEDLTRSRKAANEDANSGDDATMPDVPALEPGQRAFEIVMARKMAAGELVTTWFERHGSRAITELPADWPDDYRRLVERRIAMIESDPNIRLIEQPEYKRRWNTEPWESQLERALREWLLDRLESYFDFDGRMKEGRMGGATAGGGCATHQATVGGGCATGEAGEATAGGGCATGEAGEATAKMGATSAGGCATGEAAAGLSFGPGITACGTAAPGCVKSVTGKATATKQATAGGSLAEGEATAEGGCATGGPESTACSTAALGCAKLSLPIALTTVGKLADVARHDPEFLQVGEIYRDDPAFDVPGLVAELVEAESVPLLPALRYKPTGLRKREEWEKTWDLQRQEDAIDARTKLPEKHADFLTEIDAEALKKKQVGTIPVPPKYTSADFQKSDYWRLRGKLDVPKERWVSFPHCEGEDGTLTIAWAGYDHLQLARAISAFYVDVQERLGGRDDKRLVPLLACLIELLPWLKQWHNEIDPEFGVPMGDYFEGFLQEESRNLGLTLDQIRAWQPPPRSARRPRAPSAGSRSRQPRRTKATDSDNA